MAIVLQHDISAKDVLGLIGAPLTNPAGKLVGYQSTISREAWHQLVKFQKKERYVRPKRLSTNGDDCQ